MWKNNLSPKTDDIALISAVWLIGADSTGAAGKLPRYLWNNRGKSIILPRYYFAPDL